VDPALDPVAPAVTSLLHASDDFTVESAGSVVGTQFADVYDGSPPSRLLASTEHFAILADLSPLVAGHALLVTRENLPAMGAIDVSWWDELLELEANATHVMTEAYGTCLLVEHGSSTKLAHSPCISHAHWHLMPVATDLVAALHRVGIRTRGISSPRELAAWSARDQSYLFSRDADGMMSVGLSDAAHPLPRQFVRQEIAADLALAAWDWGLPPDKAMLRATVAELGPRLAR
jgi:diadenosine tetraphosphate (Ap4A) HIT family hydrolase